MKPKLGLFLVFALIMACGLLGGSSFRVVNATGQSSSTISISPVQTCCGAPDRPLQTGESFSVGVNASILIGESVQGFDVRVNYTNPYVVLQATGIDYSSNVFSSHSNSGPLTECVDGISKIQNAAGCAGETLGQVHFTEAILGQALAGPFSGVLFRIIFQVSGPGSSIFVIDRSDISNPNPDPSNPQQFHFQLIPLVRNAGFFGNQGVVAFFNYQPQDASISPSLLPNQPVVFDASASFAGNGSSVSFRLYSWNFGDGSAVSNATVATTTHSFRAPGNYTVSLTVWDTQNEMGSISRYVGVLPALGNLALIVKNQIGTVMRGNVNVRVFNSSSFSNPFATKAVGASGDVQFNGLIPGSSYYLTFSGDTVESFSKTELVEPGLTTYDTVYLTEKAPPADYSGLIYLGTILGGLGIVLAAIIYKTRSRRVDSSRRSSRKGKSRK